MYIVDLGGLGSLLVLIGTFYLMRRFAKENKQSISYAQSEFLKNPEAKAYIEDGYEIKKIIDEGDGIYHFELSKKVSHS